MTSPASRALRVVAESFDRFAKLEGSYLEAIPDGSPVARECQIKADTWHSAAAHLIAVANTLETV
jgi:hypothetical protein